MASSKPDCSVPLVRRLNSTPRSPAAASRFSHSARGAAPRAPASRQGDSTSSGMTKGGHSQFSALRAPAISSLPSGEPCTALVPALVGAPKPMVVLRGDQRRLVGLVRGLDGGRDGVRIVAVDVEGVPAGRLDARHLVGDVGERDRAVDRDVVVVPEEDQLVELQAACQRDGLLADAFHQAAVAADDIGVVVDEVVAELGVHDAFGQRHADAVGDALAERTGGGLDARREAVFRVAGGLGAELAEVLELVDRHVRIAGQVEAANRAASSRGRPTGRNGRGRATSGSWDRISGSA